MPDASLRTDSPAGGGRARAFLCWTFVLLVVAPLVTVAIAGFRAFTPEGSILEVVMRPTGGTAAQLFWTSALEFNETDSFVIPLHLRPGEYERLHFPLPQRPINLFRFDFINGPGEVLIRSMRVLDRHGGVVRVIDPVVMHPASQVEGIMRVPGTGESRVVTTRDATDPILVIRGSWMTASPTWYSLSFVTPLSLAWIAAAALAVIVAALLAVFRDLRDGPWTRRDALWLTGLFFTVLAARLALIDRYPMPVPYWDQWDGEGWSLYLPHANAGLTWHQMLTFHNEHRIFFSRLLAMALLQVNGQWDPMLQIAVNAPLASLAAVTLAAIMWMAGGRRYLPAVAAVVVLVSAPPFALENTLSGFQSAFYFLTLFSLLAFWLIHAHTPGTAPWWLGWLCACSALFTVGGGLLTVAAIGVFVGLRTLADRNWTRGAIDVAVWAAVVTIGYATMSPPIAEHVQFKAASLLAFGKAFVHNGSFPWITQLWPVFVVWLPLAAVTIGLLRRRLRATPLEQLAVTLGVWVIAQCAALAYSRGGRGNLPPSRYLDSLSFGFVANSLGLLAVIRDSGRRLTIVGAAAALWLTVGAYGIAQLSEAMLAKDGRERRLRMQEYVRHVQHFVVTGDVAALKEKHGPEEVPYVNPAILAGWLSHPYIREILPAAIREPIVLQASPNGDNGFTMHSSPRDRLTAWDSYGSAGAYTVAHFESAPAACDRYRYLRFDVAGNLAESGARLTVRDTVTGDETFIRPPSRTGREWTGVSVRCPVHPFVVRAVDDSATSSFAFRHPAGIAWLSVMAERAIQQWRVVALAAATILACAALPGRQIVARRTPTDGRREATR